MLDVLEELLHSMGLRFVRLDGSTPVLSRQGLIDEFTMDTDIPIFLLSVNYTQHTLLYGAHKSTRVHEPRHNNHTRNFSVFSLRSSQHT
jgi:hypothetical protein